MAVTIKDIAKMSGVSTSTVSRILNNKDGFISKATRENVLRIVKEQKYTPNSFARSLVTNQSRMLGLIMPDIVNPYFPELYRACDDAAQLRGYAILLCNTDDDPIKEIGYLNYLAKRSVDGILFASSAVIPDIKLLKKLDIPAVTIDRYMEPCGCLVGSAVTDNKRGAYAATMHLIRKGHRKIAFLCGKEGTFSSIGRYSGYEQAMEESGLEINQSFVCYGEFQHRFGFAKTKELLAQNEKFTALCCMSDTIALGAMAALREANIKIPSECAVMGYDDTYISNLIETPLSTVNRSTSEMGRQGVDFLIDYIEGTHTEFISKTFIPTLVERKTT